MFHQRIKKREQVETEDDGTRKRKACRKMREDRLPEQIKKTKRCTVS